MEDGATRSRCLAGERRREGERLDLYNGLTYGRLSDARVADPLSGLLVVWAPYGPMGKAEPTESPGESVQREKLSTCAQHPSEPAEAGHPGGLSHFPGLLGPDIMVVSLLGAGTG